MKIEIINYEDKWQQVKDAAMSTIGKDHGKYPTSEWKRRMLLAEHSPIRLLTMTIMIYDIPSYCSVHIVRHWLGIEHFVSTQRTDRTGVDRTKKPQDAPVNHKMYVNAQALITISRKRSCNLADKETQKIWIAVINEVSKYEPELASVCVPDCVYRGFCPEMKPCGYADTEYFVVQRRKYLEWKPEKNCSTCYWKGELKCHNDKSDYFCEDVTNGTTCDEWEEKRNG